ncbi:MAG: Re/Si-specific NAD(P)(+) transhydrogenase subunit alpha [Candidatus Dormibacteraeota bacterium]|nr:Re/Si-specific NAD(P)(+) transhydrogenase subunit alpha [Candidatus Dormibacteraeota bacterium]
MKLGVPAETMAGERRVALVPETAQKLIAAGLEVEVEQGAGLASGALDAAYVQAGATIAADSAAVLAGAGAAFHVQAPEPELVTRLEWGAVLVSFLQPATQGTIVEALARQGVTAFSLELLPRISRAQNMDALSSQASLAGYKAVIMAAGRLGKYFPMLMSAAGTIPPARVLVLGAGVAGLQAIATARRLGAVVEAYDVRPAVKEEVESLGARFVELPLEAQEGQGGYAREQSEEFLARQRQLLGERVAAADVVVTTAQVPGRRAPILVTGDMVAAMRPGSVVVDLGADTGGNVEVTRPGEVAEVGGVFVDGTLNVPSTIAEHASRLLARNVMNLFLHLYHDGEVRVDFEDEITRGCCITHGGEVVHEHARELMAAAR